MAAIALLVVQGVQVVVTLSREQAELEQFGNSIAESASLALSTPLWLLSGETLVATMRSYVSVSSIDGVIVYDAGTPWLAYHRDGGVIGDVDQRPEEGEGIDAGAIAEVNQFRLLERPVAFDGERIGKVELLLNDRSLVDARRSSLAQTAVVLLVELIVVFVIMRLRGHQIETTSLARVNESLRRFVPNEFLGFLSRRALTEIELGDHAKQSMAVMFLDIRSFTSLSEKLSPEENFDFINSFLGRMGPVIRRHGGFVDKYVGDGIMALFSGPVRDAVEAGIELRRELDGFNEERKAAGHAPIEFGIGIHAGELMLGTIGENERMDGTVISPAVNLAARLESVTKEFGAGLVVSDLVAGEIGKEATAMRYLGRVSVKGASKPIDIYEVFEGETEEKRRLRENSKEHFEAGVRLAVEENLPAAISRFRLALSDYPDDPAIDYYLRQVSGI